MKKTLGVKLYVCALIVLLLFQNCSIYRAKEATVDEATSFPGKVKIKTTSKETFKFERLMKEDGEIYGIARRNSTSATKLVEKIVPESLTNKFVKIQLSPNFIDEIHLKNKGLSTVLGISGGLIILTYAAVGLAFLILLSVF